MKSAAMIAGVLGTAIAVGGAGAQEASTAGVGAQEASTAGVRAQGASTGFLDRAVEIEGATYPYQIYVPREYDEARAWPVILFLHGSGERGSDGMRQTAVGIGPAIRWHPERYAAIVVMPQMPADSAWDGAPAEAAMAALAATEAEFRTDPDRVYLTGMSMGGNGTWRLAYRHPERWAAIAPVCGWVEWGERLPVVPPEEAAAEEGSPEEIVARRIAHIPTWIVHGGADPVVPASASRSMAEALEAAGADVRYTELLGVGHNAWDPAYGAEELPEWLLAQRRR